MQEIWKPIIGYENLYEISNLGNVRSLDRTVKCHSKTRLVKGKFNTKLSKLIEAYNENGDVVYVFPSLMEAHRNGFDFRLISACCLCKRSFHKGLH